MRPRVVAWGSWKEWDCVRAALFSSSSSRISAALQRITAWQARARLPVSIEITANILSIHQRDPFIRENIPAESRLSDELLRLMYAMSIMRLINGVVDDKKSFSGGGSVAVRALRAELPRSLVDIRHDSAHGELPGICLLRLASKQALEWLRVFYWERQKSSLEFARSNLRLKLLDCVSVLQKTHVPPENLKDFDNNHFKKVKRKRQAAIDKLLTSSPRDMASIIYDDTLLGETCEESEDRAWKYLVTKLTSALPQLLQVLVSGAVRRATGLAAVPECTATTFSHDLQSTTKPVKVVTAAEAERLTNWLGWLLGSSTGSPVVVSKSEQLKLDMQLDCSGALRGRVSGQLRTELLSSILKTKKVDPSVKRKLVKFLSTATEVSCKASRLVQLAASEKFHQSSPTSPSSSSSASSSCDQQEQLRSLESELSVMRTTQHQLLVNHATEAAGQTTPDENSSRSSSRGRWRLAQNWQPSSIGNMNGARPDWLLNCVPELCSDSPPSAEIGSEICHPDNRKRKLVVVAGGDDDELVKDRVEKVPRTDQTSALVEDNPVADADTGADVDDITVVESIRGCLLVNGRLQAVGPELLTALQRDIRVL